MKNDVNITLRQVTEEQSSKDLKVMIEQFVLLEVRHILAIQCDIETGRPGLVSNLCLPSFERT